MTLALIIYLAIGAGFLPYMWRIRPSDVEWDEVAAVCGFTALFWPVAVVVFIDARIMERKDRDEHK